MDITEIKSKLTILKKNIEHEKKKLEQKNITPLKELHVKDEISKLQKEKEKLELELSSLENEGQDINEEQQVLNYNINEEQSKKGLDVFIEEAKKLKADETLKLMFYKDNIVLIKFINKIFNHTHPLNSTLVTALTTEFIKPETFEKLQGDLAFKIEDDIYHIEFQTKYDNSMVIRVLEYCVNDGLQNLKNMNTDNKVVLKISRPLVIYLEEDRNIKDLMAEIQVPDNDPIEFKIKIFKMWEHTSKQLISNELYPLIPYILMRYRKLLIKKKEKYIQEFKKEVKSLIRYVNELSYKGVITYDFAISIRSVVYHLANYINNKYIKDNNYEKELYAIMDTGVVDIAGKMLEPIIKEKEEAIEKKYKREFEIRLEEKLEEEKIRTAKRMLNMGLSNQQILEVTGVNLEEIDIN